MIGRVEDGECRGRVARVRGRTEVRRRMERVVHVVENNGGRWGKGQNGKGKM